MSDILSSKLTESVKTGGTAGFITLLNEGAHIEEQDQFGNTPLILAAALGRTEIVSTLLNCGADIQATGTDGGTPLHNAKSRETTRMLLAHGASLETRDDLGRTPLHWANAASDCLDLLLNWGAEIEAEDYEGYTPLWHAIDGEIHESVVTLILRGASVSLMRSGTIGRQIYKNDFDIFLVLSKMMKASPGLEFALKKRRPDVFAALLEHQISDNDFIKIWEKYK